MRVFVSPRPDEIGKFQGVVNAFPNVWKGRMLDVGARSGHMKEAVHAAVRSEDRLYWSVDLFPPANIIANLEKGLPFADNTFDVVVALDVMEHTNNIHFSFSELCRVSNRFIVISLPNMYDLKTRIKFLQGLPLSGKYGLPTIPQQDRHRWLFSFTEAREFVFGLSENYLFTVVTDGCLVGPRRRLWKGLVRQFPNLLAPGYLALLERAK